MLLQTPAGCLWPALVYHGSCRQLLLMDQQVLLAVGGRGPAQLPGAAALVTAAATAAVAVAGTAAVAAAARTVSMPPCSFAAAAEAIELLLSLL